jgi:hypothetical protein
VRVPVATGLWRIEQWEWQQDGVMLDLSRCAWAPEQAAGYGHRSGAQPRRDRLASRAHAAGGVRTALGRHRGWQYASAVRRGVRHDRRLARRGVVRNHGNRKRHAPAGQQRPQRAIVGRARALPPASPLLVDRRSTVDVRLAAADLALADATLAGLLDGANRALIGAEIVQFMHAEALVEHCGAYRAAARARRQRMGDRHARGRG